jgi:hypothetical protein
MRYIALLAVFILLFGCTGDWKTVAQPKDSGKSGTTVGGSAEKVGYLYVTREYGYTAADDWYDVQFTLEDADGNVVTSSGTAKITVKDEDGNLLYSKDVSVSDSDFNKSYGYPFYNNKIYTHEIPFGDFAKSQTDYADFTVAFTSSEGASIKQNRSVYLAYDLVNYSYGDNYTYDYGSNNELHNLTGSATKDDVEVKLVKGGVYGYYSDYELDMDIKNAGSSKKEIKVTDAALVVGGKQYEASSLYDLDLGNVYPGAAISKSLIFYDVGEVGTDATLYLEIQIWDNGGTTGQKVEMQIPFKP